MSSPTNTPLIDRRKHPSPLLPLLSLFLALVAESLLVWGFIAIVKGWIQ